MFKKKIHVKTHIQSTACRLHPTLRVLIEDYQFRYSLSTLLANLPDEQILVHASLITVQSTFLQKWPVGLGQERIDSNPQKRKDGSKQN